MKNTNKSESEILRRKAEELLRKKTTHLPVNPSEADTLKLIHELEVHQIELELQNAELTQAKKQADAAMDKFTQLYDFAPAGYLTLSKDGDIIELNISASQMLGKERAHLLNHWLGFFVSADSKPIFKLFLTKVFNSNIKESCDVTIATQDNLPKYIHLTGIAAENGEQCLVNAVDITDRKNAEEALNQSRERYQKNLILLNSILESPLNIIIFSLDKNYCYTAFTTFHKETIKKIWGVEIFVGMNMLDVISNPEDKQNAKNNFNRALQGEHFVLSEAYGDELRYRTFYDDYYSPVKDGDGNITGVSVFVIDITDRKQIENALIRSERELKNAQQITHIGSWYLDVATNQVVWSEELYKMYGFDPALPPPPYTEHQKLFTPESWELLSSSLANTRETGIPYELELKTVSEGGSNGWMWVRGETVLDKEGKTVGLWGATQEITDRKQAEIELIKAKGKAEESDRLKTAFMNNISHEIRTPLNGILGFSQILADPNLTQDEREEYLTIVKLSSNRLMNTVTDIMDMSLIVSGNLTMQKKLFAPGDLLEEIYYRFLQPCKAKKLTLNIQTPPMASKLRVNSDQELLRKTVSHLVDNAIKFTKQGTVSFGFEVKGNELEFFVNDTGVGINKEVHATIFDKFWQENVSDTRAHEGSGLGLPIVKGFVKLLGGRIWIESSKGEGSAFFFTLPIEMAANVKSVYQKTVLDSTAKPLILIAEDEPSGSILLERILHKQGIDTLVVNDGQQAVAACRQNPMISLVLMDLKMPVMDGFEATKVIKTFMPNMPVIAITAFALGGDENRALEAGCDDYIAKPFEIEFLLGKLIKYGVRV